MERVKVTAPLLPTTIKVSIHLQEPAAGETLRANHVIINSTMPLPTTEEVVKNLTATQKKRLPNFIWRAGSFRGHGQTLNSVILYTREQISLQDWADTISECLVQKAACAGTSATSEINHMAAGAYMAFGDSLYKLQPVAVVNTSKGLAVMRKLKMEKATIDAEQVLSNAKLSASAVITQARIEREEAARVLEKARKLQLPPIGLMLSGFPFRKREKGAIFEVGISVPVRILSFSLNWCTIGEIGTTLHHTYTWPGVSTAPAVQTMFWVPIKEDGSYSITAIHLDSHTHSLPHVDREKSCMEMADNPPYLRNGDDLFTLAQGIRRLMQEANLSSLLKPYSEWSHEIQEFVPRTLLDKMEASWQWRDKLQAECILLPGVITKSNKELEKETFNTERMTEVEQLYKDLEEEADSPLAEPTGLTDVFDTEEPVIDPRLPVAAPPTLGIEPPQAPSVEPLHGSFDEELDEETPYEETPYEETPDETEEVQ